MEQQWNYTPKLVLATFSTPTPTKNNVSMLFSKLPTKAYVSQQVAIDFSFNYHQDLLIWEINIDQTETEVNAGLLGK